MEVGMVGSRENGMEVNKDSERCRCSELEERIRTAEAKWLELERENGLLRRRIEELEREKLDVENELKVSKSGNGELNQQIGETSEGGVYLVKDEYEDEVFLRLKVENRVLECEKKYAEEKWKELESYVEQLKKGMGLTGRMQAVVDHGRVGLSLLDKFVDAEVSCDSIYEVSGDLEVPGSRKGTPYTETPCVKGEDGRFGSHGQLKLGRVRKRLAFKEGGRSSKKLAPSTPGVARPASSIISIIDSDDEPELSSENMHPENGKRTTACLFGEIREIEKEIKDVTCQNSEEIEDSLEDPVPSSLTPRRGRKRVHKIVTSDSESCEKMHSKNGKCTTDSLFKETWESEKEIKDVKCENSEGMEDSLEDLVPSSLTPRRGCRRAHKIVTSDTESESDDADNLPISALFKSHIQKECSNDASSKLHDSHVDLTLPSFEKSCNSSMRKKRRRLVRIREGKGSSTSPNNTSNYCRGIPDIKEIKDDSEEGSSENDDTSMDDFIVEDDSEEDVPDGDSGSEPVDASEGGDAENDADSQDVSDDNDETYPEILSRIRRKKVDKSEWEFEADMLAAFAESPELCMRAVCALYRQQTDEEQASKATIFQNGRGFSQLDAVRGSNLAVFLLDGDPSGDLQKTVEELEARYHGDGVELCSKLARHYSKQLFEIYNNNGDPYFHPPVITDTEL